MAAKSTKSTASKGSTASTLTADVQQKLFTRLTTKLKKEFETAGHKLVSQYGSDPTKKTTLEKFTERTVTDITKKMEKVKHTDTKKVQKEFKSITDKILKEAAKVDKEVSGGGGGAVGAKASKTSNKGATAATASASKTSTTSKGGVSSGGGIRSTMEGTVQKAQKHVDDYIKACETGIIPSDGWWASIKRLFGFGS